MRAHALSGDRYVADGGEFILADIAAPPLYTLSAKPPAYFVQSKTALQTLLETLVDVTDVMPVSRWGARRVFATLPSGESAQALLVRAGAARVMPQSDNHGFITNLLALENIARAQGKGLWAFQDYGVCDALAPMNTDGEFQLVEGVVLKAAKYGARYYLNFGEQYREDFTATAQSKLYRRWAKAGIDLAAFAGARVRVRGFVEAINGPSIDLKHPLQIERL